jgi:hypothetical protein
MSYLTITSMDAASADIASRAIWQTPDWQRLWLSTQQKKRDWRSLALVPAGPSVPATFMMGVAVALSHTGTSHLQGSVLVANAQRIELEELVPFRRELEETLRGEDRVLIALPPLTSHVTALPLAQFADTCLICVLRGVNHTKDVKRTIEILGGASRVLGAAMFCPAM